MASNENCGPKGEKVGQVYVSPNDDGTATVTYETLGDYKLQQTHLYIGSEALPSMQPEDFLYSHDEGSLSPKTTTFSPLLFECVFLLALQRG